MTRGFVWAVGLLAFVAPPSHPETGRAAESGAFPSFVGRWQLDPQRSDDARAKLQEARGERGRGRFGGREGNAGGRGRGWPGGRGPTGGGARMGGDGRAGGDPEAMDAVREVMDGVLHPPQELTITQDGAAVTAVGDEGHVLRLYADGRSNRGSGGGNIERKTRWEGPHLVTETKLARGRGPELKLVETWSLEEGAAGGAGPATLMMSVKLEGGRFGKAVELRRVYTRLD
jgi:hypothetical protein